MLIDRNTTIRYPFISSDSFDITYIKGIQDIFLIVEPAQSDESFTIYTYLYQINEDSLIFRTYCTSDYFIDTIFIIPTIKELFNVSSEDGKSTIFINGDIYNSNNITLSNTRYIVEPCLVICKNPPITKIHYINEFRHWDKTARFDLINQELKTSTDSLHINKGYNINTSIVNNSLIINGSPGSGLGVAYDNLWDIGPPLINLETPLESINGIMANKGNLEIKTSQSVQCIPATNGIKIKVTTEEIL